ncbi:MAG: cytochrome c biogenesis protein CcdA [Candidatus Omnitrophica bacterium]|nr:cytochrome c biogenesis protein CcdA [Candidatus Omnitrophota bacterium]
MDQPVSLGLAFLAGLLSFLSPCVLPLIPGYLSFLTGLTVEDLHKEETGKGRLFGNACFFVAGFSAVFILLGATATGIGQFLVSQLKIFNQIAGVLIVLVGLHVLGILRWDALFREKKIHLRKKPFGLAGSFVVGATFAFGWTPCIGPILAGILAYAGTQETVLQGTVLLVFYSLGLGIPFLVTALGIQAFFGFFARAKHWLRAFEIVSGLLLVAVGILIFSGRLTVLAGRLSFLNRFSI